MKIHETQTKTGVIIPLPVTKRPMQDAVVDEILGHWEDLRDGEILPKRSDIDPRALKKALNYTFILEQHPTGGLRFRLSGSKICDCMGMELRGMPAHAIINPSGRKKFNAALHTMQKTPVIIDMQLSLNARLILLPLADADNNVARVLGCLLANPNQPDFPTRLDIRSVALKRIVTAGSKRHSQSLQLAETQTPFQPHTKKAAPKGPPVLKIVK